MPPGLKAHIAATALGGAVEEAMSRFPLETGGVLMGWRGTGAVVVTDLLLPGPAAEHHRNRFVPDHDHDERQVARVYAASGRTRAYLGDWHTHPGAAPRPSRRDLTVLRRIADDPAARAAAPLMLILGGGDPKWRGAAWQWAPLRLGTFRFPRAIPVRIAPMDDSLDPG